MRIISMVLMTITVLLISIYGNTTGWVRYTTFSMACILIGCFWDNEVLE